MPLVQNGKLTTTTTTTTTTTQQMYEEIKCQDIIHI
jgi:hypothetical protein